ncbi:MAG: IS1595 family transposase [Betaproteobacteria bacterium]
MNLTNPIFQDADKAREHLQAIRWPNGAICPHCGDMENAKELTGKSHRPGLFKCYSCDGHFTVTVGTVFEKSKVPLNKWVLAAHLIAASKKGYSAHQLHRTIGVSYKTAWFMMHRLREAMTVKATGDLGGGGGIVEADETYWGHCKQSKGYVAAPPRGGFGHKEKIVSLVERGGQVRSFHIPSVNATTLRAVLTSNIAKDANLMTDESRNYKAVGKEFASHQIVNHSRGEYSRGKATTNTVEGYFSILKRGLIGTYHHVSPTHLQRYMEEFDFRYNSRSSLGYTDTDRAAMLLKNIGGKRLMYY